MRVIHPPLGRAAAAAAPEIDQAESTLVFALLAAATPLLLSWMLGAMATAAIGAPGSPAATLRPILSAATVGVHWMGSAVLAAVALLCALRAASEARHAHGRSPQPSAWALREAYAAGAAVAAAGLALLWLM